MTEGRANPTPAPAALRCPVCGARFRGSSTCSRCGTDLSALMRVAARAWAARQASREALRAGDLRRAWLWSSVAAKLHQTS